MHVHVQYPELDGVYYVFVGVVKYLATSSELFPDCLVVELLRSGAFYIFP